MPVPRDPGKNELPSTYFVRDKEKREELRRLTVQGRMLTMAMGGPLPEQADPTIFRNVLDMACGPGDWVIDAASTYPTMSLVGIDISQLMINYASAQAGIQRLTGRVAFRVMDVLGALDFPNASFDLVNMRLGVSFMRTWDWPKLLNESWRILRPGGTLRLTDSVATQESNSAAVTELFEMFMHALFQAGHLFTHESTGLTAHLARLLTQYGYQQVQTKPYALEFRAGTPEGQTYYEDLKHFHTIRPFLLKWGIRGEDFEKVYQQALKDAQQSDFWLIWHLLSAWGIKS
jgi:ubiquinone/menaquinone biosynthesis C-methylase UbiE